MYIDLRSNAKIYFEMSNRNKYEDKNIFNELFIKDQTFKNVLGKKDLWEELSAMYEGKFTIRQSVSKDTNSFRLEISYRNQNIVLTESDTKPLRFETELPLTTKFEFSISRKDAIERILELFGKQDIKVGDKAFDKKYIVGSNKPEWVSRMLRYERMATKLLKHNIYLLSLQYEPKKDIQRLLMVKDRTTNEKSVMSELIDLQFSIIDFLYAEKLIHR